jgi:uncharacterized protein YndB with AHSA1/START domain
VRTPGFVAQYTLDMPPLIVWIALAEAEMMSGWWGEARLEPWPCGAFGIELRLDAGRIAQASDAPDLSEAPVGARVPEGVRGTVVVDGVVERIVEPVELVLRTVQLGRVRFALEALAGGTRGTSTVLHVEIDEYPVLVRECWDTHIADLGQVLLGHPVDWRTSTRSRRSQR